MSLDGYLATKTDDLSFLDAMQVEGEDYGYGAFTKNVDTYIIGRKTYEVVKALLNGKFPQANQYNCYVLTRQAIPDQEGITFYNGDVPTLIRDLKAKEGKHIYCDGGGQVVQVLLEHQLIDEFIISIIPVLLGEGKRLFLEQPSYQNLKLVDTKSYPSGLVQVRYERAS